MTTPYYEQDGVTIYLGDCREVLPILQRQSVDCVLTDPPYPEIERDYGRMSEADWHALMRFVVGESRRVLMPSGSAVFILQPNSEIVGRMRPWLWEFMSWTAREWNQVQDAWWWNFAAPPTVHTQRDKGLMRTSMKACVWLGDPDCHRSQDRVLMEASQALLSDQRIKRHDLQYSPSGLSMRRDRCLTTFKDRGGVTPFNVIVCGNSDSCEGAGALGHGAGTPQPLCRFWTRYVCPQGGVLLDPFLGSGTTLLFAREWCSRVIGIEKEERYCEIAANRLRQGVLFGGAS